ncbi:MAG TPA: hypothetical protein VG844_06000 [Terracidiphilus sp.]|jgi:hypothetical protein|nr:hypothetical protein [Terracidiphilus sp.]
MLITVGQIALVVAIVAYFGYWQIGVRRRNRQSWESLIGRLNEGLKFNALSEHFPWKEGLSTTPEETWERIGGVSGLKAIYKNAGIMLEIADFAARNASNVDPVLLKNIHADAAQIRVCVIKTLAQCLVSQATEAVRMNAFQAASLYTGLAAHMTELLQASASQALPAFVAAA